MQAGYFGIIEEIAVEFNLFDYFKKLGKLPMDAPNLCESGHARAHVLKMGDAFVVVRRQERSRVSC